MSIRVRVRNTDRGRDKVRIGARAMRDEACNEPTETGVDHVHTMYPPPCIPTDEACNEPKAELGKHVRH